MSSDILTVNRHTMANGLRIVHSPDTTTAMVGMNILYNVGARDESRRLTGMAHLFEHLMFGGSANIADFDEVLERAGGRSNAWTSSDFTNFYLSIPAQNVETAFYLESDRMLALSFSQRSLSIQQGVVIEEFKQQCLDRPYGKMMHVLREAMYSSQHPYSWPTIGLKPEHIAQVTLADVEKWFYSHYAPNNAIMAVTGNISFEHVVELAEKWFGDIPRREIAPRQLPSPGFPEADVFRQVYDHVPSTMVVVALPMSSYGTEEYFAADAITDLLSAGRASRFTSNIIHGKGKGLITSADASIIGSEHEGMLMMISRLTDNSNDSIMRARDLLMAEGRALAVEGEVSEREWQRSLNNFESTFRFGNIGYIPRASNLAQAEYHGEDLNSTVADRRALSIDAVRTNADRLFNHTPVVTVAYCPKEV